MTFVIEKGDGWTWGQILNLDVDWFQGTFFTGKFVSKRPIYYTKTDGIDHNSKLQPENNLISP